MTTKVHSPATPPTQPNNYISGECWSVVYGIGPGYKYQKITLADIVNWHGVRPASVSIQYQADNDCEACKNCGNRRLEIDLGQGSIMWQNVRHSLEIPCLPMDSWTITNTGKCDAILVFKFKRSRV